MDRGALVDRSVTLGFARLSFLLRDARARAPWHAHHRWRGNSCVGTARRGSLPTGRKGVSAGIPLYGVSHYVAHSALAGIISMVDGHIAHPVARHRGTGFFKRVETAWQWSIFL